MMCDTSLFVRICHERQTVDRRVPDFKKWDTVADSVNNVFGILFKKVELSLNGI